MLVILLYLKKFSFSFFNLFKLLSFIILEIHQKHNYTGPSFSIYELQLSTLTSLNSLTLNFN